MTKNSDVHPPSDLGLKLGTRDLVVWQEVLKSAQAALDGCEKEMLIQKEIIILAERKVEEENAKFK